MTHAHRWVLEGMAAEADGTCRICGQRRRFNGGLPAQFFNPDTLPERPDFVSLEAMADDEYRNRSR